MISAWRSAGMADCWVGEDDAVMALVIWASRAGGIASFFAVAWAWSAVWTSSGVGPVSVVTGDDEKEGTLAGRVK